MAYMQVKDILAQAEQLRKFVREYSERHARETGDDLLAGFFREANRHEQQRQDVLATYQIPATSSQGVLETWLQYPGVEDLEAAMNDLSEVDQDDPEVVIGQVLIAEQVLIEVYEQAGNQTNAAEVQELFSRLHELQEPHLRNVANCASELQQRRRA